MLSPLLAADREAPSPESQPVGRSGCGRPLSRVLGVEPLRLRGQAAGPGHRPHAPAPPVARQRLPRYHTLASANLTGERRRLPCSTPWRFSGTPTGGAELNPFFRALSGPPPVRGLFLVSGRAQLLLNLRVCEASPSTHEGRM